MKPRKQQLGEVPGVNADAVILSTDPVIRRGIELSTVELTTDVGYRV